MRKVLAIIGILIVIGAGWYLWSKHTPSTPPVKVVPATTRPDPSNATFQFEDGPITLVKGDATTNVTPDGEITTDTTLTNDIAYGDLNADGKTDAAALLVQSGAGSGVFIYVAAYVSGNVNYKGSNAIFLGDRITPKTISINQSGLITVSYLDRGPDEPFTDDPTILTTKSFVYTNDQLVEK